jgi:hypothetical protein
VSETAHRIKNTGPGELRMTFTLSLPSATDDATMRRLVADADLGAHFVVVLVARLIEGQRLDATVTVYHPGGQFRAELIEEGARL